ncbi:MAG: hypothetical protein ACHQIM_14755 [Sphingobacteriales bacterium]
MKKLFLMIALAAISFGSVYAHGTVKTVKSSMQTDTTKKKKPKTKKDSTRKKDTMKVVKQ